MVVRSEGLPNATFLHDSEADAVGQAPLFVRTALEQSEPLFQQLPVNLDDLNHTQTFGEADLFNERDRQWAQRRLTQSVAYFYQYDICRDPQRLL
jgi:hypothetical protein